jgi:Tol biopolymer transport system component
VLAGRWFFKPSDSTGPVTRYWNLVLSDQTPVALTGPGPLGMWQSAVALSPAGDLLTYVTPRGGTTALALRRLDRDSSVVLAGTEGAYHPFFSPDGTWIGFFSGTDLRKIPVAGGSSTMATSCAGSRRRVGPIPR